MASSKITKLVEKVCNLKADLKEANADLKAEITDTPLFKAIMDAILEQSDKISEKTATAQAFKLALSVFVAKDEKEEA